MEKGEEHGLVSVWTKLKVSFFLDYLIGRFNPVEFLLYF